MIIIIYIFTSQNQGIKHGRRLLMFNLEVEESLALVLPLLIFIKKRLQWVFSPLIFTSFLDCLFQRRINRNEI